MDGFKIVLIIIIFLLFFHFLSTSYEYYDNYKKDPYDELYAKLYDTVFNMSQLFEIDSQAIKNFMDKKMPIDKTKLKPLILDAGCSTGRHYKSLSKDFKVIGVEKSRNMLDLARIRNPLGKFVLGDMSNKHLFSKGKFDGIVSLMDSLNQNQDKKVNQILKNFQYWLKDEGYIFLHLFDPENLIAGPREFSQYYKDDNDDEHALTYFDNFTHDAWWRKDENGVYKYCQKFVLENGKSRLKITKLYLPSLKNMIKQVLDNNFELVAVKNLEDASIESFKLYVFKKVDKSS